MKYARIFWRCIEGKKPDDGAWYWQETDRHGAHLAEPVGPFTQALDAGKAARQFIVDAAEQAT